MAADNGACGSHDRTPKRKRSGSEDEICAICLDELTDPADAYWQCGVCGKKMHVRCKEAAASASTGKFECPSCRGSYKDIVEKFAEPRGAMNGVVGYVCMTRVPEGEDMMGCASPATYCVARWHAQCSQRGRRYCPGCGDTLMTAVVRRMESERGS